MAKPIGTIGNVDSLVMGNTTLVDLTNLKHLVGGSATTNHTSTFRLGSGTSGYQVTTGKTLTLRAWRVELASITAGTGVLFSARYADNDLGVDGTTSPTNAINYGGSSSNALLGRYAVLANNIEGSFAFPIPALKYPYYNHEFTGVNMTVHVAGYEA